MPIRRGEIAVSWTAPWELHLPDGDPPAGGWPVLVSLHGYGDDGPALAARLPLGSARYARLWPDGPFPIEVRKDEGRVIGRAWYQYTGDQAAFRAALDDGRAYLRRLMEHVASTHAIDAGRAALLGYSQGGYLAGVAALSDRDLWRGLVAIATRVKTEAVADALADAAGFPVLMLHGARDRFIDARRQEEEVSRLREHGVDAHLEVLDCGHGLRPEVAPRVDAFVAGVLGVS